MSRLLKVMFDNISGADSDFSYKIGEINIADNWNIDAKNGKEMGGFSYSNEENIFRWLIRGDILYEVEIPDDACVIKLDNYSTPNGVFVANKIIVKNPVKVTDEIALELYRKSSMPEKTYYKALAGAAIMGYINTCKELIRDRVSKDNISLVLREIEDFVKPENAKFGGNIECYQQVLSILKEIESDLLISLYVDKDSYVKEVTDDKVVNVTGESGSGKSTYISENFSGEEYVIVDTDMIFGSHEYDEINEYVKKCFIEKYGNIPNLIENFDQCYQDILFFLKDIGKTIVIDSAQFRNIKDLDLLKGKVIVIRTCVDTCYQRCIERFNKKYYNVSLDEKERYANKKKALFNWYHGLNCFLEKLDRLEKINNFRI